MGIGDIRNICNEIRKDLKDISGHFKSFPTVACPQIFRKTELENGSGFTRQRTWTRAWFKFKAQNASGEIRIQSLQAPEFEWQLIQKTAKFKRLVKTKRSSRVENGSQATINFERWKSAKWSLRQNPDKISSRFPTEVLEIFHRVLE